jgi:hypothetical protein
LPDPVVLEPGPGNDPLMRVYVVDLNKHPLDPDAIEVRNRYLVHGDSPQNPYRHSPVDPIYG